MKGKYRVTLTAHGNIDHGENPYEMLFEPEEAYADSIEECQKIVRDYINETDIGAGNWTGGKVYEVETNKQLGYISYNSRYWPKEG